MMDQFESLGLDGGGASTNASAEAQSSAQLVHQSAGTAIYRLHDAGFKLLLGARRSQVQKLLHERRVSQFLPPSVGRRHVTDVTTFNKCPALAYKWANGITLKEWLQKVQAGSAHVDLSVRLRAAMAVSKTLSDFHNGGVAYNNLTPENIVLSPYEDEYVVTFIDLSNAVILRDQAGNGAEMDAALEKELKVEDLLNLGTVLNQLFVSVSGTEQSVVPENYSNGNEYSDQPRRCWPGMMNKRGKQCSFGEGLPFYLSALISALLDPSSTGLSYESARDVHLDLKIMLENGNGNGNLMESKLDDSMAKSRLPLTGNLFYGRQVQLSMLMHLFNSSAELGNKPLMATISGYPGTGKSALVNQIKKPLASLNGFFVEGKFNKLARPDSVLASSLNTFFGNILETSTSNTLVSMKWRIQDAVGSSSSSGLLDIIPSLKDWLHDGSSASGSGESTSTASSSLSRKGIGSSHRLKFTFVKLLGAIACRSHPLILFLDDLQWADDITLDIIRMTMTDPDIRHFLFLGCYRDNEVDMSHPLKEKLNAIQEQEGVSIVPIKVGPIEKDCVNTLLSEALILPPSLCRPLSTVVHNKTGGIILFILRFLASLNDEGNLRFCMSARRWMFDLEEIRLKEIHGDVVSHMTEHMKNLSKEMRMGLMVAACLGPNFDKKVLEECMKKDDIEDTFLESCVDFGFLRSTGSKFFWSHDQIQLAAYNLIPIRRRDSFHLLVGSRLLMKTTLLEMEHMIFFIVDNMNRGSKLFDDPNQRYDVAQLNLQAGEKALMKSAFHSAAKYLLAGISLLDPDTWVVQYDLSLSLYDAASEALYVTGDFSQLSSLVDAPLMNARSFEDTWNVRNNLVRALAASSKFEEGIRKSVDILSQLGVVMPLDVTADVYKEEALQVTQLLHGKSRQELLSLPQMNEPQKLAAMQFMNHALIMTFITRPMLNPILVFRMVKMSIEFGMSNVGAFAFACYGAWLVSEPTCDVDGGFSMGQVAIEMMTRLGATEMAPRIFATVFGFIHIWKEPWQACQIKMLEAYDAGAKAGDMEFALANLYQYTNAAIYGCGENLDTLSQKIQSYAKRAFQCKHKSNWISLVVLHQLTLDLMGVEKNAFLESSEMNGMTEESCFTKLRDNNEVAICRLICLKRKYSAFLMGNLNTAAEMYHLYHTFPTPPGRLVSVLVNTFIDGLIGFCLARKHSEDEQKWTYVGLGAIQTMRKWVKSSEWSFANKLSLLEAEYYFHREDDEMARKCYDASIKAAHEHHFIHEEGLAEEKLATFLVRKGRHEEALRHFLNAKKCYEIWGARAIVNRIEKAMAILLPCIDN